MVIGRAHETMGRAFDRWSRNREWRIDPDHPRRVETRRIGQKNWQFFCQHDSPYLAMEFKEFIERPAGQ